MGCLHEGSASEVDIDYFTLTLPFLFCFDEHCMTGMNKCLDLTPPPED